MSSPTALDRAAAAQRLAAKYNTEVEPWMLAQIWCTWIGCDECTAHPVTAGRQAVCWGKDKCHGLGQNCGCVKCYEAVRQACLDVLAARGHAAPVTR